MSSRSCINRWVLVGLNLVSWVFSVVTLASCTFIKLSEDGDSYPSYPAYDPYHYEYDSISTSDIDTIIVLSSATQYGLFSAKVIGGGCESFNGKDAKDYFGLDFNQPGRVFGILQNLSLVFSMTGILLVVLCLPVNSAKWVWLVTKIMYCVALLWTSLIFLVFVDCKDVSKDWGMKCKPGAAAIINMVNFLFLLGMAIWCWFVPLPLAPIWHCCGGNTSPSTRKTQPINEKSTGLDTNKAATLTTVNRTVENTPQGRRIIEEVTHPDGSKTITETFEQI